MDEHAKDLLVMNMRTKHPVKKINWGRIFADCIIIAGLVVLLIANGVVLGYLLANM